MRIIAPYPKCAADATALEWLIFFGKVKALGQLVSLSVRLHLGLLAGL
jgi:hypothetical protein